jgi:hypothetical protein
VIGNQFKRICYQNQWAIWDTRKGVKNKISAMMQDKIASQLMEEVMADYHKKHKTKGNCIKGVKSTLDPFGAEND